MFIWWCIHSIYCFHETLLDIYSQMTDSKFNIGDLFRYEDINSPIDNVALALVVSIEIKNTTRIIFFDFEHKKMKNYSYTYYENKYEIY